MDSNVKEARDLIRTYAEHIHDQNLHGILDALCEDVIMQIANNPTMAGKSSIQAFFENCFKQANYRFDFDFTDDKIVSQVVFVNGLMTKNRQPAGDSPQPEKLDFSFILKRETDNLLRIWQIRIA